MTDTVIIVLEGILQTLDLYLARGDVNTHVRGLNITTIIITVKHQRKLRNPLQGRPMTTHVSKGAYSEGLQEVVSVQL
jgi:hypothetical protein